VVLNMPLEYINLLEGSVLVKVIGLAVITIVIMAVIEVSYRVEMMGEDQE
jgi:hypothetical protein